MNNSNTIGNATKLYGFISEYAQQNRMSVTLNRLFKADGINMMMIPMNIREDDFFYTVSNMKKSHVNGAMIGEEYRESVIELLDETNDFVAKTGFCDFVSSDDGILKPLSVTQMAIKEKLKSLHVKKVAIIGVMPLAYALALELNDFECAFYDTHIEDLMKLSESVGLEIDINRMAEDINLDLAQFDILINASQLEDFSMIKSFPACVMNIHVNDATNLEPMTQSSYIEYINYDSILEDLSATAYKIITKEYKNEY
jgi:shikimate 5-dehydrogenase